MAVKKYIDSTGLATLWEKIKELIPTIATSSKAGTVKSGGDITIQSDGTMQVNDDSHNHVINNIDGLQSALDALTKSSLNGLEVRSYSKHNNGGRYTIRLLWDVSDFFDESISDKIKTSRGFGGFVFSKRWSNGVNPVNYSLGVVDMHLNYKQPVNASSISLRYTSTVYVPFVIKNTSSNKYYLGLRVESSGRPYKLLGWFIDGKLYGTEQSASVDNEIYYDSSENLPEGYEVVESFKGYSLLPEWYNYFNVESVPKDGEGNNIVQTYATKTENSNKVDKVSGKGLSTNDYTNDDKNKLNGIASGAEVNTIVAIQRNGTAITPKDRVVNILVPVKTSELNNDSTYQTEADVAETIVGVKLDLASGIITLTRKNGTTFTLDLPTEKIIKSGRYDSDTEEIVLVLEDESEIRFSASELIDEYYADESTLELYTDTTDGNKKKFRLTTAYKNKIDGSEQTTNKTASVSASSTETQYPTAKAVYNAVKDLATKVQTFTTASTRANIESGETISTIFGKIKKWFSDLKAVAFSGSYNDLTDKPTIGNLAKLEPDSTEESFADTQKIIASRASGEWEKAYSKTALMMWNYINSKIGSILGLTASNYSGTADKANKDENGDSFVSRYVQKLNITSNDNNDGWILVCETNQNAYMQIELYEYNVIHGEESLQITININFVNGKVTGVIGNDFNNSIRVYRDGDYLRIYAKGNPNIRYRGAFYSQYTRVYLGRTSQTAINPPLGEEVTTIKREYYRKINDTLEINDSNLSTYYDAGTEILSGIPIEVGTIVFATTNQYTISAVQVIDVFNGKRIALVGNYIPSESYAHTTTSGRFSQYLYEHRYGEHGSVDQNTPAEFYEDFIYFNGIWFGKGY